MIFLGFQSIDHCRYRKKMSKLKMRSRKRKKQKVLNLLISEFIKQNFYIYKKKKKIFFFVDFAC